jgi:RNA polymerase sigma-70 factor (ECF subfamily)
MGFPTTAEYTEFARRHERSLRYALVAHLGYEAGREAVQDALVYAWEHWDRLQSVGNPGGYLFRVAKRRSLRHRLRRDVGFLGGRNDEATPWVEPKLEESLRRLPTQQRAVVFMVEGLGLTYQETADHLNISRSSVQTHLKRGLQRLRTELGVRSDA